MHDVTPVATDSSPRAAHIVDEALHAAMVGTGPAVLPIGPEDPRPDPALLAPVEDGIAALVSTSGSTGSPKAVLLSAEALRSSATATHDRLGGPGRWLLALPAHHVAGVQVLVRSRLAGTPAAVMDLRSGFRPDDFAAEARAAAAAYTSLVPTQLRRLLDSETGLTALRSFSAVLLGGAAADDALLDRAFDAGVTVVTTYGMTETCGGCVYDGRALDGVRVRLDDTGRILLGGTTLAAGYRGDVGASDAAAFTSDGWFRTADVGTWTNDGRLRLLGRADDVIVTGGENVAPGPVERALLNVDGVREACVVGVPDREWGFRVAAAIVAEPGVTLDPERIRTAVSPVLGRAATPRAIEVFESLPLRGIGKPDRAEVRRLLTP